MWVLFEVGALGRLWSGVPGYDNDFDCYSQITEALQEGEGEELAYPLNSVVKSYLTRDVNALLTSVDREFDRGRSPEISKGKSSC